MTYNFTDPKAGMQPIAETSTTQKHPIGTRVKAFDPTYGEGEFIYLKGLASTALGELVTYDNYGNVTKRAVAGDRGPAAVAMSANVANQYGWYQIFGSAKVKVAAAFAADKPCFLTATAGTVDDAVVAGDLVTGMVSKTAIDTPATGFAACQLHYPCISGANA